MSLLGEISIQTTCDNIGIEPAKKTFAELFPSASTDEIIVRVARESDGTCVYVRQQAAP